MFKRIALNGLAMLGLMAGASAVCAETAPGFYAGVGIGQAAIKIDDVDFNANDTAFKVFGGYSFNKNFGLELTYFDGGAPSENYDFGLGIQGSVDVEVTGLNLSAVGTIPVSDSFALFAKLGYASYDAKITASAQGQSVSDSGSDEDLSFGLGLALTFGQFEVRGEYEGIDISDGDLHTLSVSGLYRF